MEDPVFWCHYVDGALCAQWKNETCPFLEEAVSAQRRLEDSGRDVQMLSEALRNLSSLKSIQLGIPRILDTPDIERLPSHGFRDLHIIYIAPHPLITGDNYRGEEAGRFQLQLFIRSAAQAGFSPEKLVLYSEGGMSNNSWPPNMIPDTIRLDPEVLLLAKDVFRHLRHFHWDLPEFVEEDVFSVDSDSDDPDDVGDSAEPEEKVSLLDGHLAQILNLMPSLQSLRLDCGVFESCKLDPALSLRTLIGLMPLSPLQSIDLRSVGFHEEELIELFQAHSETLRKVTLLSCTLLTGTLKSMCKSIRSCVSLQSFTLSTTFSENRGTSSSVKAYELWDHDPRVNSEWMNEAAVCRALQDYVVGRTEENPANQVSFKRIQGSPSESDSEYECGYEWQPGPWFYAHKKFVWQRKFSVYAPKDIADPGAGVRVDG